MRCGWGAGLAVAVDNELLSGGGVFWCGGSLLADVDARCEWRRVGPDGDAPGSGVV